MCKSEAIEKFRWWIEDFSKFCSREECLEVFLDLPPIRNDHSFKQIEPNFKYDGKLSPYLYSAPNFYPSFLWPCSWIKWKAAALRITINEIAFNYRRRQTVTQKLKMERKHKKKTISQSFNTTTFCLGIAIKSLARHTKNKSNT